MSTIPASHLKINIYKYFCVDIFEEKMKIAKVEVRVDIARIEEEEGEEYKLDTTTHFCACNTTKKNKRTKPQNRK